MEALKLTGREKQIYVEAERAIGGTGLPLHSVAHGFAGAYDDILATRTSSKQPGSTLGSGHAAKRPELWNKEFPEANAGSSSWRTRSTNRSRGSSLLAARSNVGSNEK